MPSTQEIIALERPACIPVALNPDGFNVNAQLPYGLKVAHVRSAMQDFLDFLGFINPQLNSREMRRLESMLMPANFSSMVGEFIKANLPKYCTTLVANLYHNGHPDLIPTGEYRNDAILHGEKGIEIKGSRYAKGWQGHNPEDTWLMVFVYDSNSSEDSTNIRPFQYKMVIGAYLTKSDWTFSGRSETSRRTITASVKNTGYSKMISNWIYRATES